MPTVDVESLPGLKERALRELGRCPLCKKKGLEGNSPTFYVVEITRACFSRTPIERRVGLAMIVGDALAGIMGPDEDLAKIFDGPHRVFVHEECAGTLIHILQLLEKGE